MQHEQQPCCGWCNDVHNITTITMRACIASTPVLTVERERMPPFLFWLDHMIERCKEVVRGAHEAIVQLFCAPGTTAPHRLVHVSLLTKSLRRIAPGVLNVLGMKFGSQLELYAIPEWQDKYLRYNNLKRFLSRRKSEMKSKGSTMRSLLSTMGHLDEFASELAQKSVSLEPKPVDLESAGGSLCVLALHVQRLLSYMRRFWRRSIPNF